MMIFNGSYDSGVRISAPPDIMGPNSGVYSGSLSAQGNMVATQLNPGGFKTQVVSDAFGDSITSYVPYQSGYFRTYWEDPTQTTFGCDMAIPAITGVVPSRYANGTPAFGNMQGSLVFYIDLEMTRLTGNTSINLPYFINSLNQIIGWVTASNSYLAALKNAEKTSLAYYGAANYKDLITQGFDKYQTGKALITAFNNLGKMVATIPDGNFGTANAVAKTLLDNGLGGVGNLYAKLVIADVNFDDIANPEYTPVITEILRSINQQDDLTTIQGVIGSKVPNLQTPLGYCSIETASGLVNDSAFTDMVAVGKDLYTKAPTLVITDGTTLAKLIANLQSDVTANVNALAGPNTILRQDIIDSMRAHLPIAPGNNPVSVLNVIGMASGYLVDYMNEVNIGIARLYATSYGPQIRYLLEQISRANAQLVLSPAEAASAASSPSYWADVQNSYIAQYRALLNTIVNDTTGDIPVIVKQINDNYYRVCDNVYAEYVNYDRAKINVFDYSDVGLLLAFASSLPGLGEDIQNIGTDLLLYGLCQPNPAGDTVKALLGQSKNARLFNLSGIRVTGIL